MRTKLALAFVAALTIASPVAAQETADSIDEKLLEAHDLATIQAELAAVKADLAKTIEANKTFEAGMKQDAAKMAELQAELADTKAQLAAALDWGEENESRAVDAEVVLAEADKASAAKIAALETERDAALAEAAEQAELLGYAEASLKARESELKMVTATGSDLSQSNADLTAQLAAMSGWVDPAFNTCTPIRPKARPLPKPEVAKAKPKKKAEPAPAKTSECPKADRCVVILDKHSLKPID